MWRRKAEEEEKKGKQRCGERRSMKEEEVRGKTLKLQIFLLFSKCEGR